MADFPPFVLAGPILRRCDTTMVTVWLATSGELGEDAELSVFKHAVAFGPKLLNSSKERKTVKVGERLFIHLFIARGAYPTGKLLVYDLSLGGGNALDYKNLTYGGFNELPTFFLQKPGTGIRIMHGSCRKPYGIGADALAAADTLIKESLKTLDVKMAKETISGRAVFSMSGRPAVLYLTGDQIYADDVEENLFEVVRDLAIDLFLYSEHVPTGYSDVRNELRDLTYGAKRKKFTLDNVHFSTDDGEGHLLGLSEYCTMYLLVWSQLAWRSSLATSFPKDSGFKYPTSTNGGMEHAVYFTKQLRRKAAYKVADMYKSLPAVRRAMANVPCYMIFDDHDVTDDWNLDAEWKKKVEEGPFSDAGRRVVANALAAYWLFQGWGNDPDSFPDSFVEAIKNYCDHQTAHEGQVSFHDEIGKTYEETLLKYSNWAFEVLTDPPTIFADLRTQREFGGVGKVGPGLTSAEARNQLKDLCDKAGHKQGKPLVIISSLPVLNHPILALGQAVERMKESSAVADWEQWANNRRGLVDFVWFVGSQLKPEFCVFLSGEIHHSVSAGIDLYIGRHNIELLTTVEDVYYPADQNWRMIQLTSSPLKNENENVAQFMVPNGITDFFTGSDVESQTVAVFYGDTPASDFSALDGVLAASLANEHPDRLKLIEIDEFVRDSSGEADTPIQPRSCLGVVTIVPDAWAIAHESCVVTKLKELQPKIEKRWTIVDTKRTSSPRL